MLEELFFGRLKQEVARNPQLLGEVLDRIRQSRIIQTNLLERLEEKPEFTERLAILAHQQESLAELLKALNFNKVAATTPYIQALREAIGDPRRLSAVEQLVFMEIGQGESVELLNGLADALNQDLKTRDGLRKLRDEEVQWKTWIASELARTGKQNEIVQSRKHFDDIYGKARLEAIGTFLREGFFKW
jgi:hypothetical protein